MSPFRFSHTLTRLVLTGLDTIFYVISVSPVRQEHLQRIAFALEQDLRAQGTP